MYAHWLAGSAMISVVMCGTAVAAQQADAGSAPSAAAEDVGPVDAALEGDIVVTAQKREQNVQKVPISITAFSGDQLRELGITKSSEIVQQTPNLRLFTFSPTTTVYNLRGVSQNNFGDSFEAPVAVYVDDAYVGALGALSAPVYDLERVEVLRGPQGTLYGRNVTGGLIHYISKAPSEQLNGYVEATYGRFDQFDLEGAIGGAIVPGTVSGRLAFKRQYAKGYMESLTPGVRDAQGAAAISVRGSLKFDFGENFDVLAIGSYTRDDDVPAGAYVRTEAVADPITGLGRFVSETTEPWKFRSDFQGFFNRKLYSGTVKATWNVSDSFDIVSVSNILDLSKSYGEDADATEAPIFTYLTGQQYRQYSQELRVAGRSDGLQWQAGAYYLKIKNNNRTSANGFIAGFTNAAT